LRQISQSTANRGNANLLTVDGGSNLDSGSNNSQINNVGIDFIREVNIKTSNFSSEYGRNSGAAINVVTRSGENSFHGSAFEYLRNEKLDANNYFNNSRNIGQTVSSLTTTSGSALVARSSRKVFLFWRHGVEVHSAA
jgi:hypothetical protein